MSISFSLNMKVEEPSCVGEPLDNKIDILFRHTQDIDYKHMIKNAIKSHEINHMCFFLFWPPYWIPQVGRGTLFFFFFFIDFFFFKNGIVDKVINFSGSQNNLKL